MNQTLNKRVPNIIVPKNNESLTALYEARDNEGDYFVLSIPRDDLYQIWSLFKMINQKFNLCIDEYEEEDVTEIEKLASLSLFLTEEKKCTNIDTVSHYYVTEIVGMLNKALEVKTGVFFYF